MIFLAAAGLYCKWRPAGAVKSPRQRRLKEKNGGPENQHAANGPPIGKISDKTDKESKRSARCGGGWQRI
jgi:hypothetical protein